MSRPAPEIRLSTKEKEILLRWIEPGVSQAEVEAESERANFPGEWNTEKKT
jgi:hypothetical protein